MVIITLEKFEEQQKRIIELETENNMQRIIIKKLKQRLGEE